MAIRQIFKNDAECLYKKCRPVERFDKKLSDLIDDMADTMYEAEGVGLAAPQVGILRRVFVIDCGDGLVEMVNPEIIEKDGFLGIRLSKDEAAAANDLLKGFELHLKELSELYPNYIKIERGAE